MIFFEGSFSPLQYRKAESRSASNCEKNPDGTFANDNDCASSGGDAPPPRPATDNSWKKVTGDVAWTKEDLKEKSPIDSDGPLSHFQIKRIQNVVAAQKSLPLNLNEIVTLGGGAIRGADIRVDAYTTDEISVYSTAPIDPDKPDDGYIETGVSIVIDDTGEFGGNILSFDSLFPTSGTVTESGKIEAGGDISGGLSEASKNRIASVMMERFIDAVSLADEAGFQRAEMLAIGSAGGPDKGYRLWPQFGFDGEIPRHLVPLVPDELVPAGTQKSDLTIQQLIATRAGERWWDKYGKSLELTLNLQDKESLGYKRFKKMQGKLARLKARNKNRSIADFLEVELRAFCPTGAGNGIDNSCSSNEKMAPDGVGGGGGSAVADRPSSPPRDDSWRDKDEPVGWGKGSLSRSSPITGGEVLDTFAIYNPKEVAEAIDLVGITLDDAVAIGGGLRKGGDISIDSNRTGRIRINSAMPIAADGSEDLGVMATKVAFGKSVGGTSDVNVYYGAMLLDHKARMASQKDGNDKRIASLMMQKMTESLTAAVAAGATRASTSAAGSAAEGELKGYRLWPQFGFDAEIDYFSEVDFTRSLALIASKEDKPAWAVDLMSKIKNREKITVQDVISTKEGEKWWDKNGFGVYMTLDFEDKGSLGYKRFEKMKSLVEKLKGRNKNRSVFFDEIELRAFCPTGAGNGVDNSCSSNEKMAPDGVGGGGGGGSATATPKAPARRDTWTAMRGTVTWRGEDIEKGPPVTGGHVLNSFRIDNAKPLAKFIEKSKQLSSLDDVMAIGGGVRKGSDVEVFCDDYGINLQQKIPILPSGDMSAGHVSIEVSILSSDDNEDSEVIYDSLSIKGVSRGDDDQIGDAVSAENEKRITSLMMERMAESMSSAESLGFSKAYTTAAGSRRSALKGYRLWPKFGFDGLIRQSLLDDIEDDDTNLPQETLEKAADGSLTIQELISTKEGEMWWDENGEIVHLHFDFKDKSSLGYKRFEKMKSLVGKLKDRNKNRSEFLDDVEFRDNCEKNPDGTFARENDCAKGDGSSDEESGSGRVRGVDVMLGGRPTVAVMDAEARKKAQEDLKRNPKPAGSAAGSATDVWDRAMVVRDHPDKPTKITSHEDIYPDGKIRQNGSYIAHEAVGQYLSMRHEEARREAGGEGPGAIIDTTQELTQSQMDYIVDAITDDVIHAYEIGGYDPGFYSSDLAEAMKKMAVLHPEIETDENARFMFTVLTAIASNGQDPNVNLLDSDAIYSMWREHGTVVPAKGQEIGSAGEDDEEGDGESNEVGGARDIRTSLIRLQSMIDSFGVDRTRRLLSGYTTVERLNRTLKRLSDRSGDPAWKERTGSSPWMTDHFSKPPSKSNLIKQGAGTTGSTEFPDEVVPMAAIFGPKIGSFCANLSGRHDFLTMDRWLMRSIGRVTGELITRTAPESAKKSAKRALEAINAGGRSKEILFGLNKPPHNLTKADIVRSLKIQAKTGIVEENGAAFLWAKAAARSYQKVKKPDGGSYGKHSDPVVHEAHSAGNSLSKQIIEEQQTPRGSPGRRNIRNIAREVVKRVEEKYPERKGKVDVDEVQAVLWQYEKNLWKHLGAKVHIDQNSLYSKAADKLLAREKRKTLRPETRSYDEYVKDIEGEEQPDQYDDDGYLQATQQWWESELEESGIDLNILFEMLEEDAEEHRNFSPLDRVVAGFRSAVLDAVADFRNADCGRDEAGKFGENNTCAAAGGGGSQSRPVKVVGRGRLDKASERATEIVDGGKIGDPLKSAGFVSFDSDGTLEKSLAKDIFTSFFGLHEKRLDNAKSHLTTIFYTSEMIPEIKSASISFKTTQDLAREFNISIDQASGLLGVTDMETGKITMNMSVPASREIMEANYKAGLLSTDHPCHAVVHEYAHLVQFEGLRASLIDDKGLDASTRESLKNGASLPQASIEAYYAGSYDHVREMLLRDEDVRPATIKQYQDYIDSGADPELNSQWKQRIRELKSGSELSYYEKDNYEQMVLQGKVPEGSFAEKATTVSAYGGTHPLEMTAEYWTAVTLGYRENEPLLDEFCERIHMTKPVARSRK